MKSGLAAAWRSLEAKEVRYVHGAEVLDRAKITLVIPAQGANLCGLL
jgi:hypothetical protein